MDVFEEYRGVVNAMLNDMFRELGAGGVTSSSSLSSQHAAEWRDRFTPLCCPPPSVESFSAPRGLEGPDAGYHHHQQSLVDRLKHMAGWDTAPSPSSTTSSTGMGTGMGTGTGTETGTGMSAERKEAMQSSGAAGGYRQQESRGYGSGGHQAQGQQQQQQQQQQTQQLARQQGDASQLQQQQQQQWVGPKYGYLPRGASDITLRGSPLRNFPLEITEQPDKYVLMADMPGVDKTDVRAEVDGDYLTLHGHRRRESTHEIGNSLRCERSYGSFTRTLRLPADVDQSRLAAKFANGVLMVTLPKLERQPQPAAKAIGIS